MKTVTRYRTMPDGERLPGVVPAHSPREVVPLMQVVQTRSRRFQPWRYGLRNRSTGDRHVFAGITYGTAAEAEAKMRDYYPEAAG